MPDPGVGQSETSGGRMEQEIRLDDPEALEAAGLGHLRDDAPCQQCTICGRKTSDRSTFEGSCGMTQPDGFPCAGVFRSVPDA